MDEAAVTEISSPLSCRAPRYAVGWLALLAAVAACQDPVAVPDQAWVAARDARVLTEVFGPTVAADEVVATVGDLSIRTADVAEWLRLFPNLTVAQAVEDLVDVAVGAQRVDDAPSQALMEFDARTRARALAWVDGAVSWNDALTVDEAAMEEALADATQETTWRTPALATTSHFLVRFAEGQTEASHGAAACALAAQARELATARMADRPDRLARTADLLALRAPMREAVEAAGFTIVIDPRIRHPRSLAGAPTWTGPASVVEPFAEAAFTLPLDTLSEPVMTAFGCHLLVVEARTPAADVTPEQGRAVLRDALAQNARRTRMAEAVADVQARVPLRANPDAIALITASAGERLRLQQQLTATAP